MAEPGPGGVSTATAAPVGHASSGAPAPALATATATTVTTPPPIEEKDGFPVTADGYDVYQEIGAGAFAKVFRAKIKGKPAAEEVAIKVLDLDQFNTSWDEIRKEILIMRSLSHANVVKIHCSFVEGQELWIVMPLLSGGSCASIMRRIAPDGLNDEALLATILLAVLKALLYFHGDGRIHRDVKAGNILVSGDGSIQLADFGVAGTLLDGGERKRGLRTFTGTPCWMAPEVMENSSVYDAKADMWSFGITALELAYGRAPYANLAPFKVMMLTLREAPPSFEIYKDSCHRFSDNFRSLVEKCLRKDPTKRLNSKKLLEHRFFKSARDNAYIVEKLIRRLPPLEPCRGPVLVQRAAHGGGATSADAGGAAGGGAAAGPPAKTAHRPVTIQEWKFAEDTDPSPPSTPASAPPSAPPTPYYSAVSTPVSNPSAPAPAPMPAPAPPTAAPAPVPLGGAVVSAPVPLVASAPPPSGGVPPPSGSAAATAGGFTLVGGSPSPSPLPSPSPSPHATGLPALVPRPPPGPPPPTASVAAHQGTPLTRPVSRFEIIETGDDGHSHAAPSHAHAHIGASTADRPSLDTSGGGSNGSTPLQGGRFLGLAVASPPVTPLAAHAGGDRPTSFPLFALTSVNASPGVTPVSTPLASATPTPLASYSTSSTTATLTSYAPSSQPPTPLASTTPLTPPTPLSHLQVPGGGDRHDSHSHSHAHVHAHSHPHHHAPQAFVFRTGPAIPSVTSTASISGDVGVVAVASVPPLR